MLNAFIDRHKILEVGIAPIGYLCADLIVDDPIGLVNLVTESEFYISQINWWEQAPIAAGSTLGMGGPPDPRDQKRMFFSEVVQLGREFDAISSDEDYLSYIDNVKSNYPNISLHPSFDIAKKNSL